MMLFEKVLDEIYKIHAGAIKDRGYCRVCKYDEGEGKCVAHNVVRCPVVQAEITALNAGLFGMKDILQLPWLDMYEDEEIKAPDVSNIPDYEGDSTKLIDFLKKKVQI